MVIKAVKIILIIICIVVGIILLDSIQALAFNNNPLIGIETHCRKKTGILVDTYHLSSGRNKTVIKNFNNTCSDELSFTIVDKTKEYDDFMCAQAIEKFYEDDNYIYSYSCLKSEHVVVKYNDGSVETVKDALKNNHITIGDLDKFEIEYYIEEK